MSISDSDLDLDKLFLPAWAQEPASANLYAKYEGEEPPRDREGRGRRGPRRPGGPGGSGGRREGGESRPRREGPRQARAPQREQGRSGAGGRPDRGARPPGARQRDGRRDRAGRGRDNHPRERREPPKPLTEISLSLLPDEKGVDSLARQIKMTGRAYPLFEIAQMILQRPDRIVANFAVKKNAEGQPLQPLFVCALDDTLWLSEDEVISHVLTKHFATFYQAERTPTEPPKGKYTFVAQCGMSGVILGPPNYHDYQNQLRKLHAERFSRMPFDMYKSRVKIVRDEEVIKKWVEDQSFKTEYICLNMPEPLRLSSMEAVEKHFRETHKENIVKKVESHTLTGPAARSLRSPELVRLVRTVWDDQKRFPLQVATSLSQQFAARGLQFFKVNKTVTHVCVARPHYLDLESTPVSDGIKRIVDFINIHPKSTRRQLLDALAPAPPAGAIIPVEPPTQPPEGQPVTAEGMAGQQPAAPPTAPEPTAEQTAVIADLHWLIHQGHVIEFANGVLETAKKPAPKPPKPQTKQEETTAAATSEGVSAGRSGAPSQPADTTSEQQTPPEAPSIESAAPLAQEPLPSDESADAVVDSAEPVSPPFQTGGEHEQSGVVEAERPAENPPVESPS